MYALPQSAKKVALMTLGELCDLVAGRVTMLVGFKSRFDGDPRLPGRVAEVLAGYRGRWRRCRSIRGSRHVGAVGRRG